MSTHKDRVGALGPPSHRPPDDWCWDMPPPPPPSTPRNGMWVAEAMCMIMVMLGMCTMFTMALVRISEGGLW